MKFLFLAFLLLVSSPCFCAPHPAPLIVPRALGSFGLEDFPIHSSCNASQTMQLQRGLFDLQRFLRSAADHLLQHGNQSHLLTTYFGQDADPSVPLGIYHRLMGADKRETLFRCDDPDENCATQKEYNGHWRGENATGETVICNLSFETRLPIEKVTCSNGFQLHKDNVNKDNVNVYWGADLMHRAMHLLSLTNDHVQQVADEYDAVLELGKKRPEESVKNQHSLQLFAFEAFSREFIDPHGCVGTDYVPTASPTVPADAPAASNSAPSQECHTHSDGAEHCT